MIGSKGARGRLCGDGTEMGEESGKTDGLGREDEVRKHIGGKECVDGIKVNVKEGWDRGKGGDSGEGDW